MLPTFLLIAWIVFPLLVWGTLLCIHRRIHLALVGILCFLSMIAGVFLLASYVEAIDAQLLAEIEKYEPDSPEAQRASEEWANDTDRSFLLILSPVLTAFWYVLLFVLLFGLQRWLLPVAPARNSARLPGADPDGVEAHVDDGNPYQPPTVE